MLVWEPALDVVVSELMVVEVVVDPELVVLEEPMGEYELEVEVVVAVLEGVLVVVLVDSEVVKDEELVDDEVAEVVDWLVVNV